MAQSRGSLDGDKVVDDAWAVRLAVVAAAVSVLLVAFAVVAHAAGGPPVLWVFAAFAGLAARPVAVPVHRRHAA